MVIQTKKWNTILMGSILFILVINSFIGIANAASDEKDKEKSKDDEDSDGINNDVEDLNTREIDLKENDNEIQLISSIKNNAEKDDLSIKVKYNSDGLTFDVSYKAKAIQKDTDLDLSFKIIFRSLIEYVDVNGDGVYDSDSDQFIKELEFNDFQPATYTSSKINDGTTLYEITVATLDNNFTAIIYATEEFTEINDFLLTPTEIKIDIEISNFAYDNANSQLALYTKLISVKDYEEIDETEDEVNEYSEHEKGVKTSDNGFPGFLSWITTADVDGVTKDVEVSEVSDSNDKKFQKIYINYPRGQMIIHDPKIGVENLIIPNNSMNIFYVIIIVAVIGGALAIIVTSAVRYQHKSGRSKMRERSTHELREAHSKTSVQTVLQQENLLDGLLELGDTNITALSEDFIKKADTLNLDDQSKKEFIKEMLSLSPEKREVILKRMQKN